MSDATRLCPVCTNPIHRSTQAAYCSRGCAKKAQRRRATDRARAASPPTRVLVAESCRSCGASDGMWWWIGRYKRSADGSVPTAGRFCHDCYLAYERSKYAKRQGGSTRRYSMRDPETGLLPSEASCPLNIEQCSDCCRPFVRRTQGHRCSACVADALRVRRSDAEARRRLAYRVGDSTIHWRKLGQRDAWVCHLCLKAVPPVAGTALAPLGATVDHIVPIADGGEHEWHNVALAHRSCNLSRGRSGVFQLGLPIHASP